MSTSVWDQAAASSNGGQPSTAGPSVWDQAATSKTGDTVAAPVSAPGYASGNYSAKPPAGNVPDVAEVTSGMAEDKSNAIKTTAGVAGGLLAAPAVLAGGEAALPVAEAAGSLASRVLSHPLVRTALTNPQKIGGGVVGLGESVNIARKALKGETPSLQDLGQLILAFGLMGVGGGAAEAAPEAEVTPEAETAAPEAAEAAPKAAPSAKPVTAADVEKQINDALGGKGLEPNTPLRAQTNLGKAAAATAEPTALPKGFTASDSSAIKGYRYDGDAEQLTTIDRKTGTVYTHAEVSPSEFEKFENADSQGKFWNTNIRANHALVLKNGLPFRPAGSQGALRNILAGGE